MKEIALVSTVNHVSAKILSHLLEAGVGVAAMVDFPEKIMVNNSLLIVAPLNVRNKQHTVDALAGYHDAVLAYNDDLRDEYTNDLTLHTFAETVNAAREAGVARLIVVGSPDSEAFFVNDLRRRDDIDWVFISTEGDYATAVTEEIVSPSRHREVR